MLQLIKYIVEQQMQRVPWTAHHVALLAAESEDDLEDDDGVSTS